MRNNGEGFFKQYITFNSIVYANLPVGVSIYDSTGGLVYVNDKTMEIFGVQDEAYLDGFNIFTDPKTPSWVLEKIKKGENAEFELIYDFDAIAERYKTSLSGVKIRFIRHFE